MGASRRPWPLCSWCSPHCWVRTFPSVSYQDMHAASSAPALYACLPCPEYANCNALLQQNSCAAVLWADKALALVGMPHGPLPVG